MALGRGAACIDEAEFDAAQDRARDLLLSADALMKRHGWRPGDVDHCYVSIGPGSFTGLRVAVTFARQLALATGARLVAVPSLDCIAQNARRMTPPSPRVIVFLPARKDRVFAAAYRLHDGRYECDTELAMASPAAFLRDSRADAGTVVLGVGVPDCRTEIADSGAKESDERLWACRAAVVHELGWRRAAAGGFTAPQDLVPLYVRRPEAEEVWERRRAASDHDL